MTGTDWIIAISIGIIALAFVVLVIYLAITLTSVKQTLNVTHDVVLDLEDKVHAFDPYLKVVSNFGDVIEKKSDQIKKFADDLDEGEPLTTAFRKGRRGGSPIANTVLEITEWALIGLTLWQRIKKRR